MSTAADRYVWVWGKPKRKGNTQEPGLFRISPDGKRRRVTTDDLPKEGVTIEVDSTRPPGETVVALKGNALDVISHNLDMGIVYQAFDGSWTIRVDLDQMRSYLNSSNAHRSNDTRKAAKQVLVESKHRAWKDEVRRGKTTRPAIAWIRDNTKPKLDRDTITKYLPAE